MIDIGDCIETCSAVIDGVRYHEDDVGNLFTEDDEHMLVPAGKTADASPKIVAALHPKAPWED